MSARSLEDNIPDPLLHVEAEVARRIGGTWPRLPLRAFVGETVTATGTIRCRAAASDLSRRDLRSWRRSSGPRGRVGEVGRSVVSGRADGDDDRDTAAAGERCALDDALKTDGGQEVALELP